MHKWFSYFLKRSIAQRRGRFAISASAVMLTVTVVTALGTISLGVRDKIGTELRQYGANMIVTGADGAMIDDGVAVDIRATAPHLNGVSFQIYGTASIKDRQVEIIGMELSTAAGYRLTGTLPAGESELMAGINLKDALNVKPGDTLRFDGRKEPFRVAALFEKGSDQDSAIILPLGAAKRVLGIGGVSAVLLNADSRSMAEVEGWLRSHHPGLGVKTLRQVAVAEERILGRVQLLMLLVTGVVLLSSIITLGSTMGANVIERMEEIGLMKAIGATRGDIRKFFVSESALSGLAGSLGGFGAGILSAEAVSRTAFGSFVPVSLLLFPAALLLGVAIAVLATYFPVRDAMNAVPAVILRGE